MVTLWRSKRGDSHSLTKVRYIYTRSLSLTPRGGLITTGEIHFLPTTDTRPLVAAGDALVGPQWSPCVGQSL